MNISELTIDRMEKTKYISGRYASREGSKGALLVSVAKRPREASAVEILIIRTGDVEENDVQMVHRCVVDWRSIPRKQYQGQIVQIHGESGFQTKTLKEMTVHDLNEDHTKLDIKICVKEFW